MAIDLMIMPLSRYLSGDFVTPMMRHSWDSGVRYAVFGPDGKREFPKGVPFGGADAPAKRESFVAMLDEDIAQLELPAETPRWDERSQAEPVFYRIDVGSYQALLEEAVAPVRGLRSLFSSRKPAEHLVVPLLLLPTRFERPLVMSSPYETTVGSAVVALEELASRSWSEAASSARTTWSEALTDAIRLKLPLVIDS